MFLVGVGEGHCNRRCCWLQVQAIRCSGDSFNKVKDKARNVAKDCQAPNPRLSCHRHVENNFHKLPAKTTTSAVVVQYEAWCGQNAHLLMGKKASCLYFLRLGRVGSNSKWLLQRLQVVGDYVAAGHPRCNQPASFKHWAETEGGQILKQGLPVTDTWELTVCIGYGHKGKPVYRIC